MVIMIEIKNWIERVNRESRYGVPFFSRWDKNLWKKSYDEIVDYIEKRFSVTSSEVEYYFCLLYLTKHLPVSLRYLPYKESRQYKKSIGEYKQKSIMQDKFKFMSVSKVKL